MKWYIPLDPTTNLCSKTNNPVSSFARWDPAVTSSGASAPVNRSPTKPTKTSAVAAPRLPSPSSDKIDSSSSSSSSSEENFSFVKKGKKTFFEEECEESEGSVGAAPSLKKNKGKRLSSALSSDDTKHRPPKKPKVEDDKDSFVVSDEEATFSEQETLEREILTIGKQCYGCSTYDVPHACAVSDCGNSSCVLHVCSCRYCKSHFCADHSKPKLHSCTELQKKGNDHSHSVVRKVKEEEK